MTAHGLQGQHGSPVGQRIFAVLVAALFFYVASPLILPLVMGAVLAVLFTPWLARLESRGLRTPVASALLTLGITLVILLPTAFLVFNVAKTAFLQLQGLKANPTGGAAGEMDLLESLLTTPRVQSVIEWVTGFFPVNEHELVETTRDLARSIGLRIADLLGQAISALPGMVMAIAIIVVSVYFFLVDGRRAIGFIRRNSIFAPDETHRLVTAMGGICRSVILASVVSGASQALVETVFCLSTSTPNAALIGILVFMGSFIPVLGSAPITIGVAIQQFLLGRNAVGIVLLVAVVIVAALDNLVRPMFLRGSANLHPLLAFVAAFGGLQTLGFLGVFIGPVIAAVFVATVRILLGGERTETPTSTGSS